MVINTVIMAAGNGTRLLPLTKNLPKALVQVLGKPLISHTIDQLATDTDVIVTVGFRSKLLVKWLSKRGISCIIETIGKGNAWWLFNSWIKNVDKPILVLPCDNVVKIDYEFIFKQYEVLGKPPIMLVPVLPVCGVDGDFISGDKGKVLRLSRDKETTKLASGLQVVNPAQITALVAESDDFNEIWNCLIKHKLLCYSDLYPHAWDTVNRPADIVRLHCKRQFHKNVN